MEKPSQPPFLVKADSDSAYLKVSGRANYTNCGPVSRFFRRIAEFSSEKIVVDFSDCEAIDSTFLGVIAGAALELQRSNPQRHLVLLNLNKDNLRVVKDLGLQRIVSLCEVHNGDAPDIQFATDAGTCRVSKDTMLKAHEDLCRTDAENEKKFQDVLTFLRQSEQS